MNAIFGSYVGCNPPDTHTFNNADQAAQFNNSASLLSEFGATKDPETLMGVTSKARAHLVGWLYWTYNGNSDPTTQNAADEELVRYINHPGPVTDEQVDHTKLAILAVPHLRAAAGTPTSTAWDQSTRTYQPRGRLNVSPATVTSHQDPSPRSPSRLSTTPMVTRSR